MKICHLAPKVVYDIDALVEEALLLRDGSTCDDAPAQPSHQTVDNFHPQADILSKLAWEPSALMYGTPGASAETNLSVDLDDDDDDVCNSVCDAAKSCSQSDLMGKKEAGKGASLVPPLAFAATSESCNLRKAIQVGLYYTIKPTAY